MHLLLLALPLINLPLNIHAEPSPHAPLLNVLTILLLNVALPFIVLSTTAVVAQLWLYRSSAGQDYEPYPLYAASNAGSLIALLGYTFLAEPLVGLRIQSLAWMGMYIVYAILVAWRPGSNFARLKARKHKLQKAEKESSRMPPKYSVNVCTVASVKQSPFRFPPGRHQFHRTGSRVVSTDLGRSTSALYLGSFIVTFPQQRRRPQVFENPVARNPAYNIRTLSMGPFTLARHHRASIRFLYDLSGCPRHPLRTPTAPPAGLLTNFYLTIALGGWIGGAVISLMAPFLFKGLFEYPILLVIFGVSFWWCCDRSFMLNRPGASHPGRRQPYSHHHHYAYTHRNGELGIMEKAD